MRSARIFVILTAALLCVAATGLAHQGPGKSTANLYYGNQTEVAAGHVDVWNNGKQLDLEGNDTGSKLMVEVTMDTDNGWYMTELHIQAGFDPIPVTKKGAAIPGQFNCTMEFSELVQAHTCVFDLKEDFDFSWGSRHNRVINVAVHAAAVNLDGQQEGAWAKPETSWIEFAKSWGWWYTYEFGHPMRGHFIDSPVKGHGYITPTHAGTAGSDTDQAGGFWFFPGEEVDLFIGPPTYDSNYSFYLGTATAAKKISPLDLYESADTDDLRVIGVARVLQTLDSHASNGNITIEPGVAACFNGRANTLGFDFADFGDELAVEQLLADVVTYCTTAAGESLVVVSATDAKGNLEAGLNASGNFRKNVSKTEDWAETKQKLEVMPVYFPGLRSNGDPSLCVDEDGDGEYDEGVDEAGVPYEEWRLAGCLPITSDECECDPRDYEDEVSCVITQIECRDVAKPILVTYLEKIDIYDDQVNEDFWPDRFSWDTFTAVSRDDGTTWKRMNVSRMADLSSFDLETEEPFPGTTGSPYLKIDDNYILNVWESKFCKSGNPRYSINTCDDPATEEVEADDPLTEENECAVYCRGNAEQGTEVCEPDYPFDDDYYVTDIWGVRGQQQSVNYDEVDDVAELGIGEIPYSCLWAARGVIVTQKELDEGTFASLSIEDDPATDVNLCTGDSTPFDCCTGEGVGDCDESQAIGLGDIVWYKPERITSGRRDAYIPVVNSARGAGFAIAWQEDPKGLRPGKGKGPGEGWSGAISNHKTDIWYTFITNEDFAIVDETFVPGGPPDDGGPDERTGLGRPKAMVPFSLPVRVSDNDTVNTHTLKVVDSSTCVTPSAPDGIEGDPVCFPEAVQDAESLEFTFVPIAEEEIAKEFCDHIEADPTTCCDPDNHEGDPNCEDLKGLYGNLSGTKRYAYLAKSIDEIDNATGLHLAGGDGIPDYQYYVARGGTLDLCRTAVPDPSSYIEALPGTTAHERWYGFVNSAGNSKLVCVTSDGRLLDGDVFAARPMLQLQPYTRPDGSKSAWALLAYEESKGMGHSLTAAEHEDGDEVLGGTQPEDPGQDKPIKQDIGKNMIYHSFDFTQPDLVAPGHIANLPALCGGLYPAPNYCGEEYAGTNPTCDCVPGQPVPLFFDAWDGIEWMPDTTKFLQYRTEIARRARFLMQGPSKTGPSKTLGALIYKQGQEGQGRPADAFIRRFVKGGTGNPYRFENMVCSTYLDQTFTLPACPNGAGDKTSAVGYNCNVWGEAAFDRLCGGVFTDPDGYQRRDHINLTSADVDLAVDAGPDDDTPDDPTDDIYGTNKVLLWSQHVENLGDESFGWIDGTTCDPLAGGVCPGMYSNVRSHRGFIRGDFFGIAYALSPNWAAARNGNDRYNFYVRRSFDGGQTWTTNPDGEGVYVCPEFRTDPDSPDPDGSGNLPPAAYDATCGTYDPDAVPDGELPPMPVGPASTHHLDPMGSTPDGVIAQHIVAGAFEPARNISEIKSNKETSADPRLGTTPLVYPLDGRDGALPELRFIEDEYVDNMFFVAWGTADNAKSTGGDSLKTEATPLDLFYTRSVDYGDTFLKIPWEIGGENSNAGYGETVWRYDYLAKGEPEEQGECQLKATSDGSKVYAIFHSSIPEEEDPDVIPTRWYPWEPEVTYENDIWFRRVIFWPELEPVP